MRTFSDLFYAKRGVNPGANVKTADGFSFRTNRVMGENPTDEIVVQRILDNGENISVKAPKHVTKGGTTLTDKDEYLPRVLAEMYSESVGITPAPANRLPSSNGNGAPKNGKKKSARA